MVPQKLAVFPAGGPVGRYIAGETPTRHQHNRQKNPNNGHPYHEKQFRHIQIKFKKQRIPVKSYVSTKSYVQDFRLQVRHLFPLGSPTDSLLVHQAGLDAIFVVL